jgi:hypothetical protein
MPEYKHRESLLNLFTKTEQVAYSGLMGKLQTRLCRCRLFVWNKQGEIVQGIFRE